MSVNLKKKEKAFRKDTGNLWREDREKRDFAGFIVDHNAVIQKIFFILLGFALVLSLFVHVNYDLIEYLPKSAPSKAAIQKMEDTFGYPGTGQIMLRDVTLPQAAAVKEKLERVEGVDRIQWLDSTGSVLLPQSFLNENRMEDYYKDGDTVMDVTFAEGDSSPKTHQAIDAMEDIIKDQGFIVGSAAQNKFTEENVSSQMNLILVIGVFFVFLVLFITTTSWFEPVLFLTVIGTAVFINRGTNVFLPSISFITNNVAAVLQLAVSMDYSIFLLSAFTEASKTEPDSKKALKQALRLSIKTISASSLTTFVGFIVFVTMRFSMGMDLGIVLAKGIVCSIFTIIFLMPSLILNWSPFIEKTRHRAFLPDFSKSAKAAGRLSGYVLALGLILALPAFVAQGMNSFMYGSDAVGAGEGTKMYSQQEELYGKFGRSNLAVILVPDTSMVRERELTKKLEALEGVKKVTSLAGTLPEGIPDTMVPESTKELLHREGYARLLVYSRTKIESQAAYKVASAIEETVKEYYPQEHYITGNTYATRDMENILKSDYNRVNTLSLLGVFLVVAFSFESVLVALLAMVPIELAIIFNMSFSYVTGVSLSFIGYVVVSSIQLGATVDYAILSISNYMEARKTREKREAIWEMTQKSMHSILTSGTILVICGYVVSFVSSLPAIGQLGHLIGRGALVSMGFVVLLLPALLFLADGALMAESRWKEHLGRVWRERYKNSVA